MMSSNQTDLMRVPDEDGPGAAASGGRGASAGPLIALSGPCKFRCVV